VAEIAADPQAALTVPGEPVPLERARKGRGGHWYLPPASQEFRERVQTAWLVEGRPRLGELMLVLEAEFVCGRKPSHLKVDGTPRSGAPLMPPCDVTNLLKAVEDALQDQRSGTFMFRDDVQLVEVHGRKRYTEPGEEPHSEVVVWPA
jgi:Holliday junction resolvase RusA-like endonuclease